MAVWALPLQILGESFYKSFAKINKSEYFQSCTTWGVDIIYVSQKKVGPDELFPLL